MVYVVKGEEVGVEGLKKKGKGLMDVDKSMAITGGGEGVIRGLNGNGKNTIKELMWNFTTSYVAQNP